MILPLPSGTVDCPHVDVEGPVPDGEICVQLSGLRWSDVTVVIVLALFIVSVWVPLVLAE